MIKIVYQGSKNRIAKYIVPILQKYIDDNNVDTYIEPFVGGANVIDKIKCKTRIASDINKDLITLLKYAQKDTELKIAPSKCSFEHYVDVRANRKTGKYTDEYVALIGYCASYGGRYFDGGYGRDATGKRDIYNERIVNLKEQAVLLKDIEFSCCEYTWYLDKNIQNALIYLDPPYKGTKQYSNQKMDYEEFYHFCREMSKQNIVVISEYDMPNDFECIWQKDKNVLQKSDRVHGDKATEKLFVCKN